MKIKLTPMYLAAAVVITLILASGIITIGSWMGLWGDVEVYEMVQTFILNWVVVITFAIFGGIAFGMVVGVRLLSTQGFTPFEKSMLEMFSKVDDIEKKVTRMEKVLDEMKDIPEDEGASGD